MLYLLFSDSLIYPDLTQTIETLRWTDGSKLSESIPVPLTFQFESDTLTHWPDYFMPGPDIPLFSDKLKNCITKAGVDNIDYYDALVINKQNNAQKEYHAANIIGSISVMNRDKSIFETVEDSEVVEQIDHLVLDESKSMGQKIFRLDENDSLIVINEEIKTIVESSNLFDVTIIKPEDWDDFDYV